MRRIVEESNPVGLNRPMKAVSAPMTMSEQPVRLFHLQHKYVAGKAYG